MSTKIVDLTNKKNQIIHDATLLVQRGLKTPEDRANYQKMLSDIDVIASDVTTLEVIERKLAANPVTPPTTPTISTAKESPEIRKQKVSTAYRSLLKHGSDSTRIEQRDVLTSNDGAALIPQEFDSAYVSALKFYGPIATLVHQRDASSGAPQKFSISNDVAATMTYLSESTTTSSVEADPTLLSQVPATDTLVTTVKYSIQMLEDANSFESWIRDIAGLRVARAVEYALTLGKDNGSTTVLPNSPTGGVLGSVTTGATTSTLAAGIGYSDLVALAGSVDHAYYVNGAYLASPSVHNYLLGQKDSTSRPYYNVDPDTGLLMINGKPLYVNNAMPAYNAASSPVVLFGDYSRAYAYVNGGGLKIRVLRERYIADTMEGAAVIYTRLGATTLVSGAVKALVTAAS
jgi:HK97 family phage major capsid protein